MAFGGREGCETTKAMRRIPRSFIGWNDDNEMSRHDRAYHEREQEQWGGGREKISDTIDLE